MNPKDLGEIGLSLTKLKGLINLSEYPDRKWLTGYGNYWWDNEEISCLITGFDMDLNLAYTPRRRPSGLRP